ncbi:MAG: hypothetical protein ACI4RF_06900 [Eubacterium sp.]
MVLTLSEVADFKREISNRFSSNIHFHDSCAGQYFSLDGINNELRNYIVQYFSVRNMQTVFSDDGLQFTVKKN